MELRGLDAIVKAFVKTSTRLPIQLHQVSLRWLELERRHARSESAFVRLDNREEGPVVGSFGKYSDTWRRTTAGWRIERRTIQIESSLPEQSSQRA